jgi:hypothetical protein
MQFGLTLFFRLKYDGLLHITNYGTSFQWKLSDNEQNCNCNDKETGQVIFILSTYCSLNTLYVDTYNWTPTCASVWGFASFNVQF